MGYRVAVVGAAGYAGIELVRLLLAHPDFELVAATSAEDAGKAISDVYPPLPERPIFSSPRTTTPYSQRATPCS